MTDDAKRRMVWLCHGCDECDGPRPQVRPCDSPSSTGAWVVLAADFDRLRDERDRARDALLDAVQGLAEASTELDAAGCQRAASYAHTVHQRGGWNAKGWRSDA